jgi:hypothetical protein
MLPLQQPPCHAHSACCAKYRSLTASLTGNGAMYRWRPSPYAWCVACRGPVWSATGAIAGLAVRPDGHLLTTGSFDTLVSVMDVRTWRLLHSLEVRERPCQPWHRAHALLSCGLIALLADCGELWQGLAAGHSRLRRCAGPWAPRDARDGDRRRHLLRVLRLLAALLVLRRAAPVVRAAGGRSAAAAAAGQLAGGTVVPGGT